MIRKKLMRLLDIFRFTKNNKPKIIVYKGFVERVLEEGKRERTFWEDYKVG